MLVVVSEQDQSQLLLVSRRWKMKDVLRLLIAYDGSACSDAALKDLNRAGLPAVGEAIVFTVAKVLLPPAARRNAR
jgi:hypothetical protein